MTRYLRECVVLTVGGTVPSKNSGPLTSATHVTSADPHARVFLIPIGFLTLGVAKANAVMLRVREAAMKAAASCGGDLAVAFEAALALDEKLSSPTSETSPAAAAAASANGVAGRRPDAVVHALGSALIVEWKANAKHFAVSNCAEITNAIQAPTLLGDSGDASSPRPFTVLPCRGLYGVVAAAQLQLLICIRSLRFVTELPYIESVFEVTGLDAIALPRRQAIVSSPLQQSSIGPGATNGRDSGKGSPVPETTLSEKALRCYDRLVRRFCHLESHCGGFGLFVSFTSNIAYRLGPVKTSPDVSPTPPVSTPVNNARASLAEVLPRVFFQWNAHMTESFCQQPCCVVPAMRGFVGASTGPDGTNIVLCCRLSVRRAGTRYNRRGVDAAGFAANFAETEQILVKDDAVATFVSVRGSVPIRWTQPADLRMKPKVTICGDPNADFRMHVDLLSRLYPNQRVFCLNLMTKRSIERALTEAYATVADEYNKESERVLGDRDTPDASTAFRTLTYAHVDLGKAMHKKLEYAHVAGVLREGMKAAAQAGMAARVGGALDPLDQMVSSWWCDESGSYMQEQASIVRLNCLDCLDRSNLAQCMIGVMALEQQLSQLGMCDQRAAVEPLLRKLYIRHGDALSMMYAGSPAHFSAILDDGPLPSKMTIGAAMLGVTARRYWLQNFADGPKQDTISLMTGAHDPAQAADGSSPVLRTLRVPLTMFSIAGLLVVVVIAMNMRAYFVLQSVSTNEFVVTMLLWGVALAASGLSAVASFGRRLTNAPLLS